MKDILFANFAALSYTYFETVKKNRDIKTIMFDDKMKNANKMHVKTNHVFMAYSECERWETPIWDKDFDDWDYIMSSGKRNNTYCVAFKKGTDIVIAFRGTDDIDDVVDDINLGLFDKWSECVESAIDFVESVISIYRDHKLHFTGHSLGGAIAQIVGKIFNGETVTFNALGAKKICTEYSVNDIETDMICCHLGSRDNTLVSKVKESLKNNPTNAGAIDGIVANYAGGGQNSFNIIDAEVGPIKVEIGIGHSGKDRVVTTGKVGSNIIKYLKYAKRLVDNTPKCTNFIIGGDWTPTINKHYGEIVVLGDNEHKYKSIILSKPAFGLHSMGWFILFMDDNGKLLNSVRPVFIHNIVRDLANPKNNYSGSNRILNSMHDALVKNNPDFVNNEAVLLSEDKSIWKRYRMGKTFKNTIRYTILLNEIDDVVTLGKFSNCVIDGIDGRLEPIKMSKIK